MVFSLRKWSTEWVNFNHAIIECNNVTITRSHSSNDRDRDNNNNEIVLHIELVHRWKLWDSRLFIRSTLCFLFFFVLLILLHAIFFFYFYFRIGECIRGSRKENKFSVHIFKAEHYLFIHFHVKTYSIYFYFCKYSYVLQNELFPNTTNQRTFSILFYVLECELEYYVLWDGPSPLSICHLENKMKASSRAQTCESLLIRNSLARWSPAALASKHENIFKNR